MDLESRCYPPASEDFEIGFPSLWKPGRGFTFPCNAAGQVELGRLSQGARRSYFRVRTLVGREYASPTVVRRLLHD